MKAQDEAPLFCDSSGMFVEKRAMVQTWKALSGLDEAEGVSGHSARRSGAKALCRCGWELWKIQFHARWASDAVKGYTEETFAEVAEQWSLRDGQDSEGMSRSTMSLDSVAEWDQAKEGLAELRKTTSALARRLGNLERDSERKRVPWHPVDKNDLAREVAVMLDQEARFVQNLGDDGRIHSLIGAEVHSCKPKWLVADMAFFTPSWMTFWKTHGVKTMPTGRATPWPNRAETAVRLFKRQYEKLLTDASTHPTLNDNCALRDLTPPLQWDGRRIGRKPILRVWGHGGSQKDPLQVAQHAQLCTSQGLQPNPKPGWRGWDKAESRRGRWALSGLCNQSTPAQEKQGSMTNGQRALGEHA